MAKQVDAHSEMAQARQTDGLNVIFDQKSLGSSRSRSRSVCSSTSSCSTGSSYKGRETRRRYRSSTSSSSSGSSSSSRSRSRSHPRCHRRSSRCRCDGSGGHGRSPPRRYRDDRSPRRQYRAYSPSYSRSPSPDRYSRHRRYNRSRSRSPRRWDRYRRPASQLRGRFSPTPSRTYRRRSRSRSTGRSVSLSLHDKRALLEAAKANAMRMFGVEKLDLPESVKPILTDKPQPNRSSPEPVLRAKESFQKLSEENEPEPGVSSPVTSPKRKITFSENNFVAKPTVVAPSTVKVTPRVDSIESRRPYGHWIPISSGHNSRPH
uniref:Arginine/serine-rich protein 1 n=1 Tax=Iconisemion striatum TaxID=60296 RepID=A0A1A7YBT7_9TELE